MPHVINRAALLRRLVGCTEKYPLLRGNHLRVQFWRAVSLQLDHQPIELFTEISNLLVLPERQFISATVDRHVVRALVWWPNGLLWVCNLQVTRILLDPLGTAENLVAVLFVCILAVVV